MFSYQKINAFLIVNLIFIEKVSEYEILFIYVKKTYRRKGLSNYLLNNNYIQKNKSNLKKIFLEVAENNIPAVKVYKKNNFELLNIKKIDKLCYVKII
tara:strand:+ start:149 stop:442 length:294 start_codon:yes stop_codon:yes gene_type:complete